MRLVTLTLIAGILAACLPGNGSAEPASFAHSDSLWAAGQRGPALSLLEDITRQAAAAGDTALEIAAATRLGARRIAVGQLAQASEGLSRAAAMAASCLDTAALLPAVRWWSLSAGLRGHAAEADSLYDQLYALARAAGDRGFQGWACVGFASRQLENGNPVPAARWYEEAAGHLQAAGEIGGELWARNGLGIALGRQRLFHQALTVYQEVAERSRVSGSSMSRANAVNNIGNHLMLLGDPGAAQAAFRQSAALFDSMGMIPAGLTPTLNLALCEMELGDLDAAAAILDSSLVICRAQGLAESTGQFLVEKARLETARGRRNAARLNLETALAMGDTLPAAVRARAVADFAEMAIRDEGPEAALSLLDRLLPRLPVQGLGTVSWELDQARAGALLGMGRAAEALQILQAMDPEVSASGVDRNIITVKLLLARSHLAIGQQAEAVAQLRTAAKVWKTQREKPGEYRWREVRAAGGREVFLLLARLLHENPRLAREPDQNLAEVFGLLQTYKGRTLLERTAGPAFADSLSSRMGGVKGLAEFQEGLAPGDLVLDWYTGPGFSLLLTITRNSTRLFPLPGEDELGRRVDVYLELLALAPSRDNLQSASAALAKLLLDPIAHQLATARKVVSCADGPLHRLPLELVRHQALGPDLDQEPAWQGIPSLSFLESGNRRHDSQGQGMLLLAGDQGPGGELLAGPAQELAELKNRYQDVQGLVLNGQSHPLNLSLLQGRQVLHLASHVQVDNQHPWQSAVNLPFVRPSGETGPLAAATLLDQDLVCALTVLNGCATAGGRVLTGEGSPSLATAFLAAGSRCVVATLWPVDDLTARNFSSAFYTSLAEGASVARSVAAARQALKADPGTSKPLQWGGYVLFGDGDQVLKINPRQPISRAVALGLLAGGVLLVVVFRWRRLVQKRSG
jgi:CHAT domain-containing protein